VFRELEDRLGLGLERPFDVDVQFRLRRRAQQRHQLVAVEGIEIDV